MDDNIKKLELSIKEENFIGFLRGIPKYALTKSQYISSDIPTDIGEVWQTCFSYKPSLKRMMEGTIEELIEGDCFDLYIAVAYVFNYFLMKDRSFVTFYLNEEKIISALKRKLIEKKEELDNGCLFPNGEYKVDIWDDIIRWNNIMKERFNIMMC